MDSITPQQLDQLEQLRSACRPLGWEVGLAVSAKPAGILGADVVKPSTEKGVVKAAGGDPGPSPLNGFVLPVCFWDDFIQMFGPTDSAPGGEVEQARKEAAD